MHLVSIVLVDDFMDLRNIEEDYINEVVKNKGIRKPEIHKVLIKIYVLVNKVRLFTKDIYKLVVVKIKPL